MHNESYMKNLGESRIWKGITKDSGDYKNISSTQIGQQLILEETIKVFEDIKEWIHNGTAKTYRAELVDYFDSDEFLMQKIAETYLFLAGAIYTKFEKVGSKVGKNTRHRKISTISKRILPDLDYNQVWRFTEVLVETSKYFSTENSNSSVKGKPNTSIKYTCSISDVILEQLSAEAIRSFYPLPMTSKPIDWHIGEDGKIKGGYETFQYELVRANPVIKNYKSYSKEIFDSINYIQSTPWKINKELLKVVNSDLKMPSKEDFVKEKFPEVEPCKWSVDLKSEDHGLNKLEVHKIETYRKSYIEKVELFNAETKDFESAVGKYRNIKMALQIAEEFQDGIIYFPHSYDFRGRVYPIPVGLNPQGSDAIKSLLLYANNKDWTVEGMDWNWAYLASLYGEDKLPFEERRNRGIELIHADYKDADEPYQFLSHQLELQKWLLDETYNPNTRIHLDACNSGSQFTSAITGDYEGCVATNVIPIYDEDKNQIRQDAYILVADRAKKLTEDKIESHSVREEKDLFGFFKGLLEKDGRKICKVPVMVSNYGGTTGGRADILWNMFRELRVDRKWISRKNAQAFAKIIGSSIYGVLSGGKAFESYIQKMNNLIAKDGRSVTWTTEDGFFVRHLKNKELKSKQIHLLLPGARKKTTLAKKVYSDKVSPAKMKSAISPNYIHSLDAELLRRVALSMKNEGIEDSDWIHDSFGCHANDASRMLEITKFEFLSLVNREPLKLLDKQLREQVKKTKVNKRELAAIELPNLNGFDVKEGGLDNLINSEWFFS